ncbi:GT2 family glycosyltransferase [Desulfobaculum xiamenense]|uniref:GT2 family glycosyltransferase n=1 Tax=Desulfobaculum xiamenense TaxID=995050 RepID=A0A846QT87_9BACT|nr:glycosyltransferase [Desulfobaculum xiamenense]NJB68675.1 GT2 family glycosyltransferase [Desulfobaculum xiamenense]
MPDVSVIIPFQTPGDYLRQTLDNLALMRGPDFEVILLPDGEMGDFDARCGDADVVVIATGAVSPAIKRDRGAERARGAYLAFIDDDAYPAPDWLERAIAHFADPDIGAVAGPQVTPPEDGFWQKVSGAIFVSPLNGSAALRYWPGKAGADVDDWPSVNLIVRAEDFRAVGGFDSAYWPGEDTKLCLDLVRRLGRRIRYEPGAVVYHHRRSGFVRHMRQVGNYGLHRGFFAKRYPQTSRRLAYFMPMAFFLFAVFGWFSLFAGSTAAALYALGWTVYAAAILLSTLGVFARLRDARIAVATIPYQVGTHFWYGWRFLKGFLFVKELRSTLGR